MRCSKKDEVGERVGLICDGRRMSHDYQVQRHVTHCLLAGSPALRAHLPVLVCVLECLNQSQNLVYVATHLEGGEDKTNNFVNKANLSERSLAAESAS